MTSSHGETPSSSLQGRSSLLLRGIYEKQGKKAYDQEVYNKGLAVEGMPEHYEVRMKVRLKALKTAYRTHQESEQR